MSRTSKPSGAVVTTGLGSGCTTPCAIRISRKEAFWVTFKRGRDVRKLHVTVKSSSDGTAATAGTRSQPHWPTLQPLKCYTR